MENKVKEITLEDLELKVKRLDRQLDKQHSTVMNLFEYIKLRTRGRKKREMIDIIQSQLW